MPCELREKSPLRPLDYTLVRFRICLPVAVLPRRRRHGQEAARRCHNAPRIERRRRGREQHGHFQRDLQLVGRQHLVEPPLHRAPGQAGRHATTPATATTCRARASGPLGVPRRWVIYKNLAEASQMPPEWHGWMHYLVDTPPTEEKYAPRPWQKPHRMNMTGTPRGLSPARAASWPPASGRRPRATTSPGSRAEERGRGVTLAPPFSPHLARASDAAGKRHDCSIGMAHASHQRCTGWPAAAALPPCALALLVSRRAGRGPAHRELGCHLRRPRQGDGQDLAPRGAAQPDAPPSARSR